MRNAGIVRKVWRKLISLPFAVGVMVILVVLMLAGVIPARGGGQGVVFVAPIFILVMGVLFISLLFCCLSPRVVKIQRASFILTHLGVAMVLLGGFIGFGWEKMGTLDLAFSDSSPLQYIQMSDGEIINLGFQMKLCDFKIDYYPPDFELYKDGKLVKTLRISGGENVLSSRETGTFEVQKVSHTARITDYSLDGRRELMIQINSNEWQRIDLDNPPEETTLPDGRKIRVVRIYNNLPQMMKNERYAESHLPLRPGIILRISTSSGKALLSLPANEKGSILNSSSKEIANEIPDMLYSFPVVKGFNVDMDSGFGHYTAVRLIDKNGMQIDLSDAAPWSGQRELSNGYSIKLLPPVIRQYFAEMEISDKDAGKTIKTLSINHPFVLNGWRVYLNSYDRRTKSSVTLTIRRDPGNNLAVAGFYTIIIGTAFLFYVRKGGV